MLKYMRTDTADAWGIKRLQDKILEIAVYLDEFCSKYGIDYCLMGGSALGAIRHGGFIPWDDDLDVFMTPDNYEKFVCEFEKHGDKDKFFLEPFGKNDNMVTLGKIRAKNTTYIEESLKEFDISHCVYVDIFILHVCPDNKIQRWNQYIWAKYIVAKGQSVRDITRYGFALRSVLFILRCLPPLFLVKHALKQVYKYRNKKTDLYCHYLGKAKYKRGTYKREWFESTTKLPFERTSLSVPVGIKGFLSERFGDYMKIPSAEKIHREQHASVWDTEQDYRTHIERKTLRPRKYVL